MNLDPCCVLCKSALGICLSKHRCHHHKEAQAQDDANHKARQTVRRPTEDQAIANVMRDKRNRA